jgi:pyruvate,water dikinase
MSLLVDLKDAVEEQSFGGKAASLAKGMRFSLPIPDGFVLNTEFVIKIQEKDAAAISLLESAFKKLDATVVVRSSAVGEDSKKASFAGQYLSILNIKNFAQLTEAVNRVAESVSTESVSIYKKKMGISEKPLMAIIVQKIINAEMAGVMFSKNPLTKIREFVIESAWGVGETVVDGLVIPDVFKLNADGQLLETKIGIKDIAIKLCEAGGTQEIEIDGEKSTEQTLNHNELQELYRLGVSCENIYGEGLDIEWGFHDGKIYLLQCRSMTT